MLDADQIQQALEVYYRRKLPAKNLRISDVEPLQGGMSNLMVAFQLEYLSMGKKHQESLILRMGGNPAGQRREFQALEKLHPTAIPVPEVYDIGEDMLGSSFIIMEKVEGENMWGGVDGMTEVEQANVWKQFATILADIHRLDWRELGFEFLDPPQDKYDYANGWLSRLRKRFELIEAHGLDAVFDWLEEHKPASDNHVLLHEDYHPNNVLVHQGEIAAILDWEGVAIGDAAYDVCMILLLFRMVDQCSHWRWSGSSRERFLGDYREATGSDLANLEFYLTLKALVFLRNFLPRFDIDKHWRHTVLGTCAEVIWEKTDVRVPSSLLEREEEVPVQMDPAKYEAYVGDYDFGEHGIFSVSQEGNSLFAQVIGGAKHEIFPRSESEFFSKVVRGQITFVADDTGNVVKAIVKVASREEIEAPKIQ